MVDNILVMLFEKKKKKETVSYVFITRQYNAN